MRVIKDLLRTLTCTALATPARADGEPSARITRATRNSVIYDEAGTEALAEVWSPTGDGTLADNVTSVLDSLPAGSVVRTPDGGRVVVVKATDFTDRNGTDRRLVTGCQLYAKGSCHNSDSYDDFRWQTQLKLRRTSDGWTSSAGWSKTPTIANLVFPPKTLVDITVTCERTGTWRLKCPYFYDVNSGLFEKFKCQRKIVQVVGSEQWYCSPN